MAEQAQVPQSAQPNPLVIGDTFTPPIHTDGIFSIRMLDDSVRIVLFSYMAAASEPPKPVVTGCINMSLKAFLKSVEVAEDYVKNLEQAGVIKRTPDTSAGTPMA